MYNVLMFGTGKSSIIVKNVLSEEVNILAYIDNDKSRWGQRINDVIVVSPDKIKDYNYDYIIIGSQFNEEIYSQLISLGIKSDIIFQYYKFTDNYWNYHKYYVEQFINNTDEGIELLATGISYAYLGFIQEICCKKSYKLAFGSQDLFYDYKTIKYLLENAKEKTSNVKYLLIGLCYYSFQYDMSLSAMRNKTVLYYEILKTAHHFKDIDRVYAEYDINKKIADKIFRKNKDGNYDFKWDVPTLADYEDKESIGKRQAEVDCNKDCPKTVEENMGIFREYLELLKSHNIKPVVVVYPATKYYTKHFSKKIEDEFHLIIDKFKKKYNFQYLDYFRSDLFLDEDFDDVSHLNWSGAEKFTRILNEVIDW